MISNTNHQQSANSVGRDKLPVIDATFVEMTKRPEAGTMAELRRMRRRYQLRDRRSGGVPPAAPTTCDSDEETITSSVPCSATAAPVAGMASMPAKRRDSVDGTGSEPRAVLPDYAGGWYVLEGDAGMHSKVYNWKLGQGRRRRHRDEGGCRPLDFS